MVIDGHHQRGTMGTLGLYNNANFYKDTYEKAYSDAPYITILWLFSTNTGQFRL